MVKDRWAESGGVKSGREGITVERRGGQKARKSERRRRKIKLRSLRSIGNMRQLMGQNMNWDQQWEFIIYTESVTDREESHI